MLEHILTGEIQCKSILYLHVKNEDVDLQDWKTLFEGRVSNGTMFILHNCAQQLDILNGQVFNWLQPPPCVWVPFEWPHHLTTPSLVMSHWAKEQLVALIQVFG